MRTSELKLNSSLKNQIIKTLSQTIADLKNPVEADIFIKDFFTNAEIETFAKRLAVAYWLKKGRSYTNIKTNLKVSSATIADVASQKDKKGFKLALQKAEAEEWATLWAEKIKKFVSNK
jgi:TrpR-related protein YerC/YecD